MLSLCFVLVSAPLNANSLDANNIIEKMKNVYERRSISEKLKVTLKNREQETGVLVLGVARKVFPDGKRIVMVSLEPEALRGVSFLFRESKDGTIAKWIYPPYLGRVRKIGKLSAYDSILNSDFNYADIGFIDPKSTFKLLGEEELEGNRAYKIEIVPNKNDHHHYSRIIIWVSKDTFLPLRRDFYDGSNTLWKRQLYERITIINGLSMPFRIRMLDLKAKTSTELNVIEANFDIKLPDEMFVPEQLIYSLKCPVWEKVCYSVEK